MNETRFWQIISDSRSEFDPELFDGNLERQAARLREILEELAREGIVEFARHFDTKFVNAYRWDLWAVARLVERGCSDDGFMDFRYWLISMGRQVYEAALANPDSLVAVVDTPGFEVAAFEEFGSVADQIYEELTGDELPNFDITYPKKPAGKRLDDDDLAELCPKLWEKYGE
jgi:hypothetical protein